MDQFEVTIPRLKTTFVSLNFMPVLAFLNFMKNCARINEFIRS